MKTRAIFVIDVLCLMGGFFFSNIGCFNLFKNKYKRKAHSDDLPCKSKMNYL